MSTYDFTAGERKTTLYGLLIVFLLAALDQTIVATAMPRIISELHGLALYAWVTTAYLLTSTVMVPIWGKLGDLYGRKPMLIASIIFFLVGSWLSGLSGEFGDLPVLGGGMTQLIVFRAIQGIGGGGLFTVAFAIIADLFPPRERGRYAGLFGAVFGLSSTVGPLIGGYFTDHGTVHLFGGTIEGWRWVFYLNLPLSLLSLFMILVKMPKMSHAPKGKVDVLGAALLIATFVPLLLALTFGGHTHPWNSAVVLGLFAVSAAGLIAYVLAERFASDPILPLSLFGNKTFWTGNLAGFLISMAFMSTVAFLPLFMQLGQGVKATTSGLFTLPLMGGLMISSISAGRIASRTGHYKWMMVAGVVVTFVGIFLMSSMHSETSRSDLAWRMLVLGIGLGPGQSLFNIAIQNALPPQQLGVVTSSTQFFRQIGSTMGVALFGTFLTNHLNQSLGQRMPGVDLSRLQGMVGTAGPRLVIPPFVKQIIASAVTDTFALGLYVLAAAAIVTLLIPNIRLRDRAAMREAAETSDDPNAAIPAEAHL